MLESKRNLTSGEVLREIVLVRCLGSVEGKILKQQIQEGEITVSYDSLLPPLSLFTNPYPLNLEAGSERLGCRKPRGSTALPPGPRDVIGISYSETEPRRAAEEVAALFLLPCFVGSNSSRG